MGKSYKEAKKKISQILEEKGGIYLEEVIKIMEPYLDIDIEKLKEQELRRVANRLIAEYKKRQER